MNLIKSLSILVFFLALVAFMQIGFAEENTTDNSGTDVQNNVTINQTIAPETAIQTEKPEPDIPAGVTGEPVSQSVVGGNTVLPATNTSPQVAEPVTKQNVTEKNQTSPSAADIQKAFNGWYEKAQNASATGNYKSAADAYAAALRLDKDSEKAQSGYAAALSELGRDTESLDIYSRLWNKSPNDTTILIPLGRELNAVGNHESALTVLLNATVAHPDDQEGWNQLAAAYAGLSRYEEALTAVRRSLQLSMDKAGGWGQLGMILSGQGRFYEAVAAFEKALTLDPTDGIIWTGLGNTWTALNRYDDAAQAYQTATENRPSDTALWIKLAKTYEKQNNLKGAAEAYKKGGIINQVEADEPVSNQSKDTPNMTPTKPDDYKKVNTTEKAGTSTPPVDNATNQTTSNPV